MIAIHLRHPSIFLTVILIYFHVFMFLLMYFKREFLHFTIVYLVSYVPIFKIIEIIIIQFKFYFYY